VSESAYRLDSIRYRYPGRDADAIGGLSVSIGRGSFNAVIGPNGAGKSTLVRLLSGLAMPTAGSIFFQERPIASWDRVALARTLAVVTQDAAALGMPLTVREYVELGRNPYVSPWASLGPRDREVLDSAIERTDLAGLAGRPLSTLSGGERQRARLARALAQEPDVLMLDEPTAFLDLRHALWVFEMLQALVAEGVTVVCVTHDVPLASRFVDRMLLLSGGVSTADGLPREILPSEAFAAAYECEVEIADHGDLGLVILPLGPRVGSPAA
jgi:iron complex transport system ATP-binding protein